jgi:integrase
VSEVIDEYIAHISPDEDRPDKPFKRSWATTAKYLTRYAKPYLGSKIISEVTSDDVAHLLNGLDDGTLCKGGKPSRSNAIHVRTSLSPMFKWAAQSGRSYLVGSPMINLPQHEKLPPRRVKLTIPEIHTLWHGLDRPDRPCSRATALALKFQLVTMMRHGEFRDAPKDGEIKRQKNTFVLQVPGERMKRGKDYSKPLTSLALRIMTEAKNMHPDCRHLFSADGKNPLSRTAMSQALRGVTYKGKVKHRGLCEWLGIKAFRPHDLRRTAAHFALAKGGQTITQIALCLDHAKADSEGITNDVYVQDPRIPEKLATLSAWEAVLKDIIAGTATDDLELVSVDLDELDRLLDDEEQERELRAA